MLEMGRRVEGRGGEERRGDGEISCGEYFLFLSFFFLVSLNMKLLRIQVRLSRRILHPFKRLSTLLLSRKRLIKISQKQPLNLLLDPLPIPIIQ